MVKTGNVTWDLYLDGEIQAASKAHKAVTEDLTDFCKQFAGRRDLGANACAAGGALLQSTATLLAYRTGEGNPTPQTWADMWDSKTFPGERAFPNFDDPWRVMAAALLADGVSREELFPLDVERALRKLDEDPARSFGVVEDRRPECARVSQWRLFSWTDMADARKGDAERRVADRLVLQGIVFGWRPNCACQGCWQP